MPEIPPIGFFRGAVDMKNANPQQLQQQQLQQMTLEPTRTEESVESTHTSVGESHLNNGNKVIIKQKNSAAGAIIRTIQGAVRPAGQPRPPTKSFQKSQQHKSRSHTIKDASFNVQKETALLRQRLDRVVAGYQHSVAEHDKAQCHRLKKLSKENQHLQKHNRNLEVENLKLSNDLFDHEEQLAEMKVERQELVKELRFYRTVLADQKKEKNVVQSQLEKQNSTLVEQNTELTKKVAALMDRDTEREKTIKELEVTLERLRSIMTNNKENDSFSCTSTATPARQSKRMSSQTKKNGLKNSHGNGPINPTPTDRVAEERDKQIKQHCMQLRSRQAKKT